MNAQESISAARFNRDAFPVKRADINVREGSLTPPEGSCLDGTFWFEDNKPYMVFHTFDGTPTLVLHRPNDTPRERMVFLPFNP